MLSHYHYKDNWTPSEEVYLFNPLQRFEFETTQCFQTAPPHTDAMKFQIEQFLNKTGEDLRFLPYTTGHVEL